MESDVHRSNRLRSGILQGLGTAGWLMLVLSGATPVAAEEVVARAHPSEVVALVHPSNPTSSMSVKQLRMLFGSYKRSWEGGTPVQLLLPPEGDPAMAFLVSTVFRKQSEDDVSRYYLQAVYQQKLSNVPAQLSRSEALNTVRRERGAIVLLDRASVGDATGLRMLQIED